MKILVLLPASPSPWAHAAARYYGPVLKALDHLGHRLTVIAVRSHPGTGDDLDYFEGTAIRFRFYDPPTPRPLLERKLRSGWRSGWELLASDFGRAARLEAQQNYDAILAEDISTARTVEGLPRVVLSLLCLRFADLTSMGETPTYAQRLRILQTRRAERTTIEGVRTVRVLSRRLEALTKHLVPNVRTFVVPLCIDLALYEPVCAPRTPTVGVVGSMFWEPSRAAATHFIVDLVPRLRRRLPDLRFLVAGWQAERYLGATAKEAGVEVMGDFLDPREVFQRLSALVYAPPVGTGMKVKVLEAMAYGVPAVVNSEGFEGLEADSSPPVCLADSDDAIVESVLDLVGNREKRKAVAEEGRRCLARSFSPPIIAEALAYHLAHQN
jgi:glycosyltransferase involved in cell wall biosynthesis